jgi:predicted PurR-regulated permease PerM
MAERTELRISGPVMLSCAAFVVIVAGLRAAQPIVVPLIVAAFIAMICLPALHWLQGKGLPTWAALGAIATVIVLFGLVIVGVIGTSVNQMREELPEYQARVIELEKQLRDWLKEKGIDLTAQMEQETFNPERAISLFGEMLGALGSVLGDALVIIFTLLFMVFEAAELPAKLRAISDGDDRLIRRMDKIQDSVRRYITLKTQISLLNAVLVTLWLWWLGVDFALLWGLLTFLFNFIPNIGSIISAIPPVVLALLQFGFPTALLVTSGYLVIETVVGNLIEPRLMGRGLGLSPLVVFVSLLFWGWVLGPIGMLFSVPLTMVVKIVLDNSQDMQWLGVLLGAEAPKGKA